MMTGGSDALIKVFLVEKSSRTGPFSSSLSVSRLEGDTEFLEGSDSRGSAND